ncbi:ROK family transcriptional regulator [Actinocrinis sp.]|uniref:ROK family transcriptional regulator n=1 Tax=Actinocrinis sp. TaxID=1920516 RepID=UPI002B907958|nr:ROK family transcriptional regulator [Actinocrinis sp.]HXR72923.1 ROK family transcriptional regulator [Actinocrinis sp.]
MTSGPVAASRAKTRGVVLDLIRAAHTVSRVELAANSGLTPPTITQVVRELMEHGLVVEVGRGTSTGGKPPTLLQLNPRARYSIGVLFERNICVVVITDLAGRPVARTSFHGTELLPPELALPLVASRVEALLGTVGVERGKVLGVGLVSYGPQDQKAGVLLTPQPTAEWFGYPIAHELSELLGLPVLLDNDAAAAAIGEYWLGAVEQNSTYGCIYMATGIGGAVVSAGEVYRGSSSNSVEIGHISIDPDGEECDCGNYGCLENYAGPGAVVRQALATEGLVAHLGLDPLGIDSLADFALIATAAAGDDPAARGLIERSARHLAVGAVTMATLFDLDLIVLAGPSFAAAGPIFRSLIEREVQRRCFAKRAHPVTVVQSVSGSDAAAIGGAVLVLQSELAIVDLPQPV